MLVVTVTLSNTTPLIGFEALPRTTPGLIHGSTIWRVGLVGKEEPEQGLELVVLVVLVVPAGGKAPRQVCRGVLLVLLLPPPPPPPLPQEEEEEEEEEQAGGLLAVERVAVVVVVVVVVVEAAAAVGDGPPC